MVVSLEAAAKISKKIFFFAPLPFGLISRKSYIWSYEFLVSLEGVAKFKKRLFGRISRCCNLRCLLKKAKCLAISG